MWSCTGKWTPPASRRVPLVGVEAEGTAVRGGLEAIGDFAERVHAWIFVAGPNRSGPSCVNPGIEHNSAITESFESFYQRERRRALAIAYALTGTREGAEDLVQDAFEALHPRWTEILEPAAYLRRTMTNLSTSRFRRLGSEARALDRLRRRRREFVELEPADAELWSAVAALPLGQRAVVVLYYLEDRSIDDVAQILEIAPGTAKSSLHDARAALARVLGTVDVKEMPR